MFDPNLPQEGTEIDAVQMRSQLNGLKALIDAIVTLNAAQVDAVNTLPPGSPATAGVSVTGATLRFTFALPRGDDGMTGPPGPPGGDGPQGPPFAQAVVDAVNTLPPGSPATVGVAFDGVDVRFTFGLPAGADGSTGPQGPPGEVTQAALDAAIASTSANSNGVATLGEIADGSYSQAQMQTLFNKMDELIQALRR